MIDKMNLKTTLDGQEIVYIPDIRLMKFLVPDIEQFSKLLREKINDSKYKNDSIFARASKTTKQNVSRILNLQRHTVTNALPSVGRETVIKWAEALNWDVNEALILAGHAPENHLPSILQQFDYSLLSESDLREIVEFIYFKIERAKEESGKNDSDEGFQSMTIEQMRERGWDDAMLIKVKIPDEEK